MTFHGRISLLMCVCVCVFTTLKAYVSGFFTNPTEYVASKFRLQTIVRSEVDKTDALVQIQTALSRKKKQKPIDFVSTSTDTTWSDLWRVEPFVVVVQCRTREKSNTT